MCDYSLENVHSRPAALADRLVTTTFANTITRGFAAARDLDTAVCLMPGTELAFDRAVEYDHPVTHRRLRAPSATARFCEVDRYVPYAHHDALEFPDGTIVPLTRLVPGQHATVLQLPARTATTEAAKQPDAAAEASAGDASAPRTYEIVA